ncbi:MAG: zinc ribbon domain-containing protein [Planctomycetales bacterium]|nr:zinc ribbon domain-containing protein [Planctomycetales bacterium]
MPIYEYTCDKCQTDFELLVRSAEQPACPTCGSANLSKQFSVPAAHVSGVSQLPVCTPPMNGGGCGLPQCGTGRCGME